MNLPPGIHLVSAWQTVKISQDVYEELLRRRRMREPAVNDVLRRLLELE